MNPPDPRPPRSRRSPPVVLGALLAVMLGVVPATDLAARGPAPSQGVAADPGAREESPGWRGLPLSEALDRLEARIEAQGLELVYTSQLVAPDLRVLEEPRGATARETLEELLGQHGLTVQELDEGLLVVVRKPRRGSLSGRILTRVGGAPEGVRVRWAAPERLAGEPIAVGADGAFEVAGLAPGVYGLEASAPGYLPESVEGVEIEAGESRSVVFRLIPIPNLEDEILVRPSRVTLLREQPGASFDLGRDEIDSLPHLGGDPFRATPLLPGVTGNDVSARFSVHGGRRDEVRVLLDGQELYDPYHLQDYDGALSIVSRSILAGIELQTGAYPAPHGDRMSAVMDLRTREPSDQPPLSLQASVLEASLAVAGELPAGRGDWFAAGRRGSLDLANRAVGAENPRFWDLFGRANLETGTGRWSLYGLVAADDLSLDGAADEGVERLSNTYRSSYLWLRHTLPWSDRLLLEHHGSWSQVRRDRDGLGIEGVRPFVLADERILDVYELGQAWSLELSPDHLPRWGWEGRRYRSAFDYRRRLDPRVEIAAPFSPPRPERLDFDRTLTGDHLAVWASDRWTRGRLTAEAGLRYDRHTATDDTLWSPRLNLAWLWGERTVLRGGWGYFYQSQRPHELRVEDGETELAGAERSDHWVLGVETRWPELELWGGAISIEALRVEVFARQVDDPRPRSENLLEPLDLLQEIEADRVRIAPVTSRSRGIEALLRGHFGSRIAWWMAYAHARAEDRLDGSYTGSAEAAWVPRSLDQPHTLVMVVDVPLPRDWRLDLAWRYRSGWPITPVVLVEGAEPEGGEPASPAPEVAFGALNSRRLPLYHRLDLRLGRSWPLRRGELTFFLDVQNLYDRQNRAGFDADFRVEDGRVRLERVDWPGIFPSLGVRWQL